MATNDSVRAFKCPTCGAPLEPEVGTLTMKCSYCGGTAIIPESLWTPPSSGPSMGDVFNFGLKGVDLNQIVGNAMHLPQAISLAQQGRIDEAAPIYSQITGMEHADAMSAVNDVTNGHAVSLSPGRPGATWQQFETSYSQPSVEISTPAVDIGTVSTSGKAVGRSCGLIIGIVAAVALLIVALVGSGLFMFSNGTSPSPIIPIGFAGKTLTFGTEGIGAGMFQDPRDIGVDSNGIITVADYQDGRIQTFDSSGKFASGFSISAASNKVYVSGMAVGRDGEIYLAHDWRIFVYDPSGNKMKEIGDDNHRYKDVVMGADGKLYALANEESIVRFKPDGKVDLEIKPPLRRSRATWISTPIWPWMAWETCTSSAPFIIWC